LGGKRKTQREEGNFMGREIRNKQKEMGTGRWDITWEEETGNKEGRGATFRPPTDPQERFGFPHQSE